MQAGHELAVVTDYLERPFPHPRHDPEADGHVRRVGDLHADVGDGRAERTHREGHDVHRAPLHAPLEERRESLTELVWVEPVVVRPGVLFLRRGDVCAALDAGDVAHVGVCPVAVGAFRLGQARERPLIDEELAQPVVLGRRPVAPFHARRLGQGSDVVHPLEKLAVTRGRHCLETSFPWADPGTRPARPLFREGLPA